MIYDRVVAISGSRLLRLIGLACLLVYSALLLLSSLPVVLWPWGPLVLVKRGASIVLHEMGVTPGLEVFPGRSASRAIPHMTCFRVVGEGVTQVVLFDNLERCRTRRVAPIRDPFEVFQTKSLTGPLVDLDLGHRLSLVQEPMQPLFLFSDYYCHTPEAERAQVKAVRIDAIYLGWNLDDDTTGRVDLGGRRVCSSPRWELRGP